MNDKSKGIYISSVDTLRVAAIAAVILIHSTTTTLQYLDHNVNIGFISLFLNQSARFAVPLFFLISGFLLELNYRNNVSYSIFFKRRASKILIPFIFWSLFYFLIGNGLDFKSLLSNKFLEVLLEGKASYHLYFIPILIIFYLLFPILHKFINFLKNPLVLIPIIIGQGMILFNDYYGEGINIHSSLRIACLVFAMFLVGMVASHYWDKIISIFDKFKILIILSTFILQFIIFFHVKDLTATQQTTKYIYNQYSPANYIYTILVALILGSQIKSSKIMEGIIVKLSKLTFFVFFIHVFILTLIWDMVLKKIILTDGNLLLLNFWFDLFIFFIVTFISFSLAFIAHKIPGLSRITG